MLKVIILILLSIVIINAGRGGGGGRGFSSRGSSGSRSQSRASHLSSSHSSFKPGHSSSGYSGIGSTKVYNSHQYNFGTYHSSHPNLVILNTGYGIPYYHYNHDIHHHIKDICKTRVEKNVTLAENVTIQNGKEIVWMCNTGETCAWEIYGCKIIPYETWEIVLICFAIIFSMIICICTIIIMCID